MRLFLVDSEPAPQLIPVPKSRRALTLYATAASLPQPADRRRRSPSSAPAHCSRHSQPRRPTLRTDGSSDDFGLHRHHVSIQQGAPLRQRLPCGQHSAWMMGFALARQSNRDRSRSRCRAATVSHLHPGPQCPPRRRRQHPRGHLCCRPDSRPVDRDDSPDPGSWEEGHSSHTHISPGRPRMQRCSHPL